jgi:glycosyltransferase involved in cell wall biosynthesis
LAGAFGTFDGRQIVYRTGKGAPAESAAATWLGMRPNRHRPAPLALAIGGNVRENLRYCVILPAYNEGRHLTTVVGRIPDWVSGIIIVDDASTDDTLTVAESLTDTRCRVEHHEKNSGVGGAMVTGFRAALDGGFDVAIKIDADDQMDVRELPILVRPIQLGMAEYVKGNRFRRTGRPSSMPRRRWLGNVVLSFLTKVASGYWHVFDPQCGFIAITTPTLRRLKLDGIARDYFFENDMLIRLNVIDARVVDVDTSSLYGDETSYLSVGRASWTFPPRLLRGFFWRFIRRHLMNDFGLIGLLSTIGFAFTLFGSLFGLYHWILSASTGVTATTGTVMVAVVPVILGVQMLLQGLSLEVQSSAGASETREYARIGYTVGNPPADVS